MTDSPILFSAPMVRAILAGRKTQTRRIVKRSIINHHSLERDEGGIYWVEAEDGDHHKVTDWCPYGQAGDRLWVRETWTEESVDAEEGHYRPDYRATANGQPLGKWKPSIHMPRKVSRITLEITGVRVEPLRDISADDALAEGIDLAPNHPGMYEAVLADNGHGSRIVCAVDDPTEAYRALWNLINGSDSWDSNPFVWVVEFKRVTP